MLASDQKLPVGGGAEKRAYVRAMFAAIAPTYDRLNRILSLRLDLRWRRQAVRRLGWERAPEGIYLDLCAGTLDFAAALAREPGFRGRIVGADLVRPMLELGRGKAARLEPVNADALELPFAEAIFDGAMIGWGVRNLADPDAGLAELARVLKPGARVVILDMATPAARPLRWLYLLYFEHVLPRIGRLVSRHASAYQWLPASTRTFPAPPELARRIAAAGFGDVRYQLFLGGVTALHIGVRSS
ncbi:MAG TPA: ubiquinone/menaquinone biosynthesis methyltransferase [Gemmatimonadales bacterium]|nr:ubiquinone/menaquinone biosynthesis methyltransferase [Gemmatimonadales bacterium]